MRRDSDYENYIPIEKEDLEEILPQAEKLITSVKEYLEHTHMFVEILLKMSVSSFMGFPKGKSIISHTSKERKFKVLIR